MIDSQSEFLMEVTDKTKADVKVRDEIRFRRDNDYLLGLSVAHRCYVFLSY